MSHYVAYYRVSTDKQGRSGLGLDAQRQAVADFVAGRGDIAAEFTEVESGRKNDRPQLVAALAMCRKQKARLIIAKLDRLARNVHFISGLMESGVDFMAVDMPEASRLTIHILAAVAEHEREMISKRTTEALKAARARGTRLGNPNPRPASAKAVQAHQAQTAQHHAAVAPVIRELQGQGLSLRAIAKELTRRHIPTAQGGGWYATTVGNLLRSR